jgi:uncharacterized phage protein (TIGR01671 family)
MKREIKFRAWNKKDKVMVDVAAMNFGPSGLWSLIEDAVDAELQLADGYELMQYTGLKDKNGREIYEGDVVSFGSIWARGDESDPQEESHCGVVEFDSDWGMYKVNCGADSYALGDVITFDGYGVIGNIFENPELLEDK